MTYRRRRRKHSNKKEATDAFSLRRPSGRFAALLDNQSLPESEIKRDMWNVSRLRVKHTGQETAEPEFKDASALFQPIFRPVISKTNSKDVREGEALERRLFGSAL